jgi:GT2 family glycosyltransferase
MAEALSISVVLVNWNAKEDLRSALASLDQQTDRDFQTIVVDNGSTDGSLAMMRAEFPWVLAVDGGTNLGFAEGCNRGIESASGAWVAVLNNDAVAAPDWIFHLRRAAAEGGPRLGMVQARILFKQRPTMINSTGVLIYWHGMFIDRDYDAPVSEHEASTDVFCVSAGAALYRRAMLDELRLESGFFDRTFFMYFEDVDLGWRARLAGYSAVYEPKATVYHAFHGSSQRRGAHFVRLQCGKNRLRTVLKNGSKSYIATSSPRIFIDFLWALVRQGPRAVPEFWAAGASGLSQRRAVGEIAREERRSIERQWLARRQKNGAQRSAG